jgi:hypothetical protein
MRTPRYVATVSAGVLAVTLLIASVVRALAGSLHDDAVPSALGEAALGSVFLGASAWLGTYLGARNSAPYQRSDRLIRVLRCLHRCWRIAIPAVPDTRGQA